LQQCNQIGTLANTTGCKEFNLFTGMAHNYDPDFEVDTNKFNLLTDHLLEVWCGGNTNHHNWLLSWLANIIQRPQQKIGIAVVLSSEAEGAGKGIIVEWFGKEAIGQEYYTKIDEIGQLTSQFTKHLAGKLFTLCDEIQNYGGAYKSNDLLKNIITHDHFLVEGKGENSYELPDYNNYVFATNNDWAIKVCHGQKIVLDCSNKYAGNKVYFKILLEQLESKDTEVHFFHWLAKRDVSEWRLSAIPETIGPAELQVFQC